MMEHFICFDANGVIWGIGDTREEAEADAKVSGIDDFGPREKTTMPCSKDLKILVETDGGETMWARENGIAIPAP